MNKSSRTRTGREPRRSCGLCGELFAPLYTDRLCESCAAQPALFEPETAPRPSHRRYDGRWM